MEILMDKNVALGFLTLATSSLIIGLVLRYKYEHIQDHRC